MKMLEQHEFIIGTIVSIIALLLNITEAIFLIRQRIRRSNYQTLILSLSLADILTALFFIMSFVYRTYFERSLTFNVLTEETLWFSITSSLLHVLSISFDRLLAIRFPIKHRCWYTSNKNRTVVILVWAFSFLLILPSILTYFFTKKLHLLKVIMSWVVLTVGALLAALYTYIIRRTVSKKCMIAIIKLKSGKREVISACSPREKRILLTSIFIVTSFIVCTFPFAIVYIASGKKDTALLFLIANSILNPVIYFFQRHYYDKRSETMRKRTEKEAEKTSLKLKEIAAKNVQV